MAQLTTNFSSEEFACPCGCGNDNISPSLVNRLQEVRDVTGLPVYITSGVRCAAHNASIGGVKDSAHVPADLDDGEGEVGHAVDIGITNSIQRFITLQALMQVGFTRIGIGKSFIHADTDTRKPLRVMWDYYEDRHVG